MESEIPNDRDGRSSDNEPVDQAAETSSEKKEVEETKDVAVAETPDYAAQLREITLEIRELNKKLVPVNAEEFEQKRADLDARITKLRQEQLSIKKKLEGKDNVKLRFSAKLERLNAQLTQLVQAAREKSDALSAVTAELDRLAEQRNGNVAEAKKLRTSLVYETEDEVDTAVRAIELQLATETLPNIREENRLINEIRGLKTSKKAVEEYRALQKVGDSLGETRRQLRETRQQLGKEVGEAKDAVRVVRDEISKILDERRAANKVDNSVWDRRRAISEEMNTLIEERRKLYTARDAALRENSRFHEQIDRLQKTAYRLRKKQNMADHAEYVRQREAEKEVILPHVVDIDRCNQMIAYLEHLVDLREAEGLQKTGIEHAHLGVAPVLSGSCTTVPDEAELIGKGKNEEPNAPKGFLVVEENEVGGSKKKKGKKGKKQRAVDGEKSPSGATLTHGLQVFELAAQLKMEAPTTRAGIPQALEEVKAMKERFAKLQQDAAEEKKKAKASTAEEKEEPAVLNV